MKGFLKKWLGPIIIVVTLTAVMIIGMVSGNLPKAVNAVMSADPLCIALCVLCYFIYMMAGAMAICSFLKREGYHLRLRDSLSAMLTAIYYSNITPGATGGQPMQIAYLKKFGIPVGIGTSAIASFFIAWHVMRVVLLAGFGLFYKDFINQNLGQYVPFLILGFTYNVVLVVLWLLFCFSKKPVELIVKLIGKLAEKFRIIKNSQKTIESMQRTADKFHTGMTHLKNHKSEIFRQLFFGTVYVMSLSSILYFAYRGIGLEGSSYGEILSMGFCQYISAAYMPTPGASGAQEGIFRLYFGSMMPGASLLAVMMIWRFMSYYLGLIVGAAANLIGRRNAEKEKQENIENEKEQEQERRQLSS